VSFFGFIFLFWFALMTYGSILLEQKPAIDTRVLVVSSAGAFVFLKESVGFSQVNSKVLSIGFLMLLRNAPQAWLLGVPDYSSEFVFCFNFVCVGKI